MYGLLGTICTDGINIILHLIIIHKFLLTNTIFKKIFYKICDWKCKLIKINPNTVKYTKLILTIEEKIEPKSHTHERSKLRKSLHRISINQKIYQH